MNYGLRILGETRRRGAFAGLTIPTRLVTATNETYDLGGTLLTLPNGNILNLYCGGTDANQWGVVCMQQSSNGGTTWTPYAGSTQGTGINPYGCLGMFYSGLT